MPNVLSEYSTEQMRQLGIKVLTNCRIKTADLLSSSKNGTKISLQLTQSDSTVKEIEFDHVIVSSGAEPNVSLAQNSGFDLDELGFYV